MAYELPFWLLSYRQEAFFSLGSSGEVGHPLNSFPMDSHVLRSPYSRTWGAAEPLVSVGEHFGYPTRDIDWLERRDGIPQRNTLFTSSANAGQQPNSLNVLLVEDTYSTRRQYELILMNRGHRVVTAADGRTAVELATKFDYDVILMDLQLPILNGWQATEAIRRHEELQGKKERVPIIAQTAYAVSGNRMRSLAVGMNDFLSKPIDPKRLIEVVEQHARCRSTER